MKIFVTGIAGTGKTTVADELKRQEYSIIDIDTIPGLCAWVNNKTEEKAFVANPDSKFMDEHEFKCDVRKLQEMLDKLNQPIFAFACVGDNSDLMPLFDKTILFQCSPETHKYRLDNRNTNQFGKDKSTQKQILDWKKVFDQKMIDAGAVVISTEQPIEDIARELIDEID